MNIDSDVNQMTMADCLLLTQQQQALVGFVAATQAHVDGLAQGLAMSYNPTMDFYTGSSTPYIDTQDAVYCINYVVKRWRFVYNASLSCAAGGALLSLEIAGGKVGTYEQA